MDDGTAAAAAVVRRRIDAVVSQQCSSPSFARFCVERVTDPAFAFLFVRDGDADNAVVVVDSSSDSGSSDDGGGLGAGPAGVAADLTTVAGQRRQYVAALRDGGSRKRRRPIRRGRGGESESDGGEYDVTAARGGPGRVDGGAAAEAEARHFAHVVWRRSAQYFGRVVVDVRAGAGGPVGERRYGNVRGPHFPHLLDSAAALHEWLQLLRHLVARQQRLAAELHREQRRAAVRHGGGGGEEEEAAAAALAAVLTYLLQRLPMTEALLFSMQQECCRLVEAQRHALGVRVQGGDADAVAAQRDVQQTLLRQVGTHFFVLSLLLLEHDALYSGDRGAGAGEPPRRPYQAVVEWYLLRIAALVQHVHRALPPRDDDNDDDDALGVLRDAVARWESSLSPSGHDAAAAAAGGGGGSSGSPLDGGAVVSRRTLLRLKSMFAL